MTTFGEPFLDHFRCKRPLTGYLSVDTKTSLKIRADGKRDIEPITNMALLTLCVKIMDDCFDNMKKRVYEPKQIFDEKCLKYGGAFLLSQV